MKIMPVQKQTRAGQRTRFKAYVVVGDFNGHVGLGVKCSKEVASAIRGAIIDAKLSVIPVRRGYWGANIGAVHTVPTKVTGKCGSVTLRLVPAPKGTGIVAARVPKKLLQMAGIGMSLLNQREARRLLAILSKLLSKPSQLLTVTSLLICGRKTSYNQFPSNSTVSSCRSTARDQKINLVCTEMIMPQHLEYRGGP